jgi:Zn ribbon nucleic-acid-binding protein
LLLLKACPHCHGDLTVESDARCTYFECLQCGHTLSREEERALGVRLARSGVLEVREHAHTLAPRVNTYAR